MPESKPRKRKPAKKRAPVVRKSPNLAHPPVGLDGPIAKPPREKVSRNPAREIPEDERYVIPELPEPADYVSVLVALADMDPLAQEVLIAQRLSSMPNPGDPDERMAIPINRQCRGPWAHHLRKLGIFCIPELATHESVDPDAKNPIMANHTAASTRLIDRNELWAKAKEQNPRLAALVDGADTPEKKQAAMKVIAAQLPVEQRIALDRLIATAPEALEPK